MEIDDMQSLWQRYDERLDAYETDPFIARDAALDGVRTTLGRLTRMLRVEVVMNALAVVLLGGFAADHLAQPSAFVAAVVLDIYAIAILAAGIAQLVMVMKLDYVSPVLPIATSLASLRLLRARATFATLALAPLMWVPLLVVGTRALFGVDAAAEFGTGVLGANFAFGLAVLVAAIVIARRYGSRFDRPRSLARTLDALSGRDVRDATAYLHRLIVD